MEKAIYRSNLLKEEIKPDLLLDEYYNLVSEDIDLYFKPENLIELPELRGAEHIFSKLGMNYCYLKESTGIFLSPRPTKEALQAFYNKSKSRKFWFDKIFEKTHEIRNKKIILPQLNWINSIIIQHLPQKNKKSVEINPSHWSYLEQSKNIDNLEYSFFEPLMDLSLLPTDLSTVKVYDNLEKNTFDIVFLFESLDRTYDPFRLIKDSINSLKKGGICFITCLLSSGFEVKSLGKESDIFFPPEKMNLLSYEGLVDAINATNSCDIIEFSTPSLFDLDNVYSKLDLSNEKNFIKYIMNERNDTNVKKSFRDFLQENQLGSFARVAIKKIK